MANLSKYAGCIATIDRYARGDINKIGHRILGYHSVSKYKSNDIYTVHLNYFKEHIKTLSSEFSEFISKLDNKPFNIRDFRISITFDDGFLDNLRYAAPILEDYKFPYTIFVVSEFVRSNKIGYMNSRELIELSKFPLATIGCHSKNHLDLTKCNSNIIFSELSDSKKYLEDLLGIEVLDLAYPFGAVNSKIKKIASDCKFDVGVTTYPGINGFERDRLMLKRTLVLNHDDTRKFKQKIQGSWDWLGLLLKDPLKKY